MTFTQWYKYRYNDEWTDNHAILHSLELGYEQWCADNNQEEIWDA